MQSRKFRPMRAVLKICLTVALFVGAAQAAAARTIHIVAFGDSATAGWLVPRDQAYPAQLQAALRQRGYDVVVKNAGINGGTFEMALQSLDRTIDPGTDIAIIEFGTNDLHRGALLQYVRERLATLIRALRARKIEVLVIGLGSLNLSDVAKANDVAYAQWMLPPGRYRAGDGAHFNAQGYAILVARMLPQVEELIARRSR